MKNNYVETKIITKFGKFNIRVYAEEHGKEPIVLWTENLDPTSTVLVRIHSECITGDLFGSFHCDCGDQLTKSLKLIHKEGGVLIYLRQEGRGIGLFEKIKTYQLQSKGHDTFEANTVLGHHPDYRTYEMVKIALNDLKIRNIRLLTNNPYKVSEVAKLGIKVVERVPIVTKCNKYNRHYLETKQNKFQHFLKDHSKYYFYQFHAETLDHVKQIGKFLKNKKRDPLLKIFVGISANHLTLTNKKEISRLKSIFHACGSYKEFITVLHFSFRNSPDVLEDLKTIKEVLPFVNHLQINDLPSTKISYIKLACSLFSTYIPFSDENFDLIHKKSLRNLIKKHKAFVLLDNSKGRGIQESKKSLMKKINTLLSFGLNDIAIFGGFGPDKLNNYFDLRRYYRINFSIDAETNLKTNGKIDLEKTKLYLLQLIRFDDPNKDGIEQTKKFLKENRRSTWDKVIIENKEFKIHPKVFHAGKFPSTAWYTKLIIELTKKDKDFCEIGCGSGVISCMVAITNPKINVTATDISPFAVENTKINAKLFGLENRMNILISDVLDSVPNNKRFDSILWLLPFGYLDPGTKVTFEELQVFDPGYKSIRKFFKTAKNFLKPNGKLLIGFSHDLGHPELIKEFVDEFNIKLKKVAEKKLLESHPVKFELLSGIYLRQ